MESNKKQIFGIGDPKANFKVYMGNYPLFIFTNSDDFGLNAPTVLEQWEIYECGKACGNGWRKVFNVYAKLIYALSSPLFIDKKDYKSWQDYRDNKLLQKGSNTALIFSQPKSFSKSNINIIMGKTYSKSVLSEDSLTECSQLHWLTDEFAVDEQQGLIICPYFDYRQLSNAKILHLIDIIHRYFTK